VFDNPGQKRKSLPTRIARLVRREGLFPPPVSHGHPVRTDRPYLPALTSFLRGAGAEVAALIEWIVAGLLAAVRPMPGARRAQPSALAARRAPTRPR